MNRRLLLLLSLSALIVTLPLPATAAPFNLGSVRATAAPPPPEDVPSINVILALEHDRAALPSMAAAHSTDTVASPSPTSDIDLVALVEARPAWASIGRDRDFAPIGKAHYLKAFALADPGLYSKIVVDPRYRARRAHLEVVGKNCSL